MLLSNMLLTPPSRLGMQYAFVQKHGSTNVLNVNHIYRLTHTWPEINYFLRHPITKIIRSVRLGAKLNCIQPFSWVAILNLVVCITTLSQPWIIYRKWITYLLIFIYPCVYANFIIWSILMTLILNVRLHFIIEHGPIYAWTLIESGKNFKYAFGISKGHISD